MGRPSEDGRKRIGAATRAIWKDPSQRERLIAARVQSEPRRRTNLSISGKAAWRDPAKRRRMLANQFHGPLSDEAREKKSEAMKREWSNPDVKKRRSAAIRKGWSRVPRKP